MVDYETILNRAATHAIADSATIVAKDIPTIVTDRLQFASPDPEIGAELGAAIPQEPKRIAQLTERGRPYPETPRYNTGKMIGSISAQVEELYGTVSFGSGMDFIAAEQQYGRGADASNKEWPDPVPSRPFFGVSDRALKKVEAAVSKVGNQLEKDLNAPGDELGRITVAM